MKNNKSIIYILSLALLILVLNASEGFAQPTNAQLIKQLTSAKTVSVTLDSPGKIEWSKTYKKYVWSRYFTAKLKTDTPGEFLIVKGYASYDVMGGRYVFWRTFTSSNNYEGKKNPSVAELNKLVETMELRDVENQWEEFVGEIESIKIYSFPNWEWHTPNSVSFNVVMVYSQVLHGGVTWEDVLVARVERIQRWRIYRDDAGKPWKSITAAKMGKKGDLMRGENNESIEMFKILESKKMKREQTDKMPRPTKVSFLTE